LKQLTLEGFKAAYTCRCGKCFDTMSELKKHHARHSRKVKVRINFVLENYKMISTKEIQIEQV